MSGTTWKKKSKHGFPVERNVGEKFSVRPFGGFPVRSISGDRVTAESAAGFVVGFLAASGPRSVVAAVDIVHRRLKRRDFRRNFGVGGWRF